MNSAIIGSFIVAPGWSLVPIFYKTILHHLSAKTLFILYYLTAGLYLSMYLLFNWNHLDFDISKITRTDVVILFMAVLAGSIVANYVYYSILEKNQTYLVTILTSVSPILTILIASIFLNETITPR